MDKPLTAPLYKEKDIQQIMGAKFKNLRLQKRISQQEMGDFIGLTRVSVANIENGRQGIKALICLKICAFFGCSPNDIYPSVEEISRERIQVPQNIRKLTRIKKTELLLERLKLELQEKP